jgi:hypothetical protein
MACADIDPDWLVGIHAPIMKAIDVSEIWTRGQCRLTVVKIAGPVNPKVRVTADEECLGRGFMPQHSNIILILPL